MSLWKKVLVGLVLGVILGLVLEQNSLYLKPFGDIFIRLIKMIIVPLIFLTIVGGITNIDDSKSLRRISIKTLLACMFTTLIAITIGLGVGSTMQPGKNLAFVVSGSDYGAVTNAGGFNIFSTLLELIPDNIIAAMAQGSILQIVFFALFTGITINSMGNPTREKMRHAITTLSEITFQMISFIMQLSPIAACCLTAWVVGTQGIDVLKNLTHLILCAYVAFSIQYVVMAAMIALLTKLSPLPFLRKSIEYQALAFSTSSSKASLPTTIKVCREKLGISKTSSSFVLPLGASINMGGVAIYISLCALFFAQAYGIELTVNDYFMIILTSTLGSIGAAGIPGGTIVMLPMVLSSVGLPLESIALIVGIDRIVDMMRTAISITGDAAIALCIDHSEGTLNHDLYYRNNDLIKEHNNTIPQVGM